MKFHNDLVIGKRINFRKIVDADLKILVKWRNSKGIREYNNQFILLNAFQQKNGLIRLIQKNLIELCSWSRIKKTNPLEFVV